MNYCWLHSGASSFGSTVSSFGAALGDGHAVVLLDEGTVSGETAVERVARRSGGGADTFASGTCPPLFSTSFFKLC